MCATAIARERLSASAWLPPWTKREHEARYVFCSPFATGRAVVDCACGSGLGSRHFIAAGPTEFHGFDIDEEAVRCAKLLLPSSAPYFSRASALSLPLPDASTDLFISLETIEHIAPDRDFVREAARVLRPGGDLICSTPNRLVTNPGALLEDAPWNPYHVREYSPKELIECVAPWFDIHQVFGQNPVSRTWKNTLEGVARLAGTGVAVRVNQILKCRWFLWVNPSHHAVVEAVEGQDYEYMVVLGRRKNSAHLVP